MKRKRRWLRSAGRFGILKIDKMGKNIKRTLFKTDSGPLCPVCEIKNGIAKAKMRIRYVDGFKIRNEIDVGFTLIHHRNCEDEDFPKSYIPEGEIWIDRRFRGETRFLLKSLRTLSRLRGNLDYDSARKVLREKYTRRGPMPDFVRREKRLKDGLKLKFVDGSIVRRWLDPEFVLGGHDLVYDYIPKGEVWAEAGVNRKEYRYIAGHEVFERKLMAEGMDYDTAHDQAEGKEALWRSEGRNLGTAAANYSYYSI